MAWTFKFWWKPNLFSQVIPNIGSSHIFPPKIWAIIIWPLLSDIQILEIFQNLKKKKNCYFSRLKNMFWAYYEFLEHFKPANQQLQTLLLGYSISSLILLQLFL